ncbi:aldehyde ferredoxin oxidoreductase family protein [Chloroflexota bacterium]
MYGWAGQRLKVYLTEGKIVREEIPERLLREYLGGRGLNAKTLFDEVKPGIDPLSPANVFIVGVGPLGGTLAPGTSRWTVTTKSPLTGIFGDGNGGGYFAAELKFAGYDQVIFYGRAPKPVYLWINDNQVELRDASHLWGRNTWETHHLLTEELGEPGLREICIGPAGENKVRLAQVISNLSRSAGKGGLGAVMGSKNLKAVAVRGTGSVRISKPDEFLQAAEYAMAKLKAKPPLFAVYQNAGTLCLTPVRNLTGTLGTRNHQAAWFYKADKLGPTAFREQYGIRDRSCFSCPIHCSHYYEVKEGPYITHGEGCEFGTVGAFGPMCGNDDLASTLLATTMCDQLGMDTMSCAPVIAFAMEAWQRKLISSKDTDGLDLGWGNSDSIIQLILKIAYREGFGDILAEGTRLASQHIEGSSSFTMHIKGMECEVTDPRPVPGYGLAYATSTRGYDHARGWLREIIGPGPMPVGESEQLFGSMMDREKARDAGNFRSYAGKGVILALCQNFKAAVDSLEMCWHMTGRDSLYLEDMVKLLSTATGMGMDGTELSKVGERVYNVEKAFNIREGLRREDDTLPSRYFLEETPDGPNKGQRIDYAKFQVMLDEYYEFRGWDREGIPTEDKLKELNLTDVAEELRSV